MPVFHLHCSVPGEDKWSNTEGRDLGGPGLVSGHACKQLVVLSLCHPHLTYCGLDALLRVYETKVRLLNLLAVLFENAV